MNFLRLGGQLQLLKAILFSIQSYWAMYLFLPIGILKRIQGYMARFLWSGSYSVTPQHKMAWQDCCLPKHEGGLGLRDLFEWD